MGLNLIEIPLKTGPWNLSDLKDWPKHGLKVLSTFSCGGGSTMGYKLAGFDVIGAVEIDPEMASIYKKNHNPKHLYKMPIQEFNKIPNEDLPKEFFELDILDGSPPCSSFSMAGSREKKWGKAHHFREGQAKQNLDDLFFNYIETVDKLKPKVAVAENVKGLIQGNAKGYVKQIFKGFRDIGYSCQLFLLNSAFMGVPQKRERTFFIANRLDKKIKLQFDEKTIPVRKISDGIDTIGEKLTTEYQVRQWRICPAGSGADVKKGGFNSQKKIHPDEPALTQTGSQKHFHYLKPNMISDSLVIRIQSFPDDYRLLKQKSNYICGMSVPPFMMQRIALQIYKQLLVEPTKSAT